MTLPKLLIIGESGAGKDELCKILADHFGYRFASASMIACDLVVFDALKEEYDYSSVEECHADRRCHIPEWVDIIADYNGEDGAALAKQVMQVSDIYCGVRKRHEFEAMLAAKLFDCIIYVDASIRLGVPDQSYVEVYQEDAHFVVDNNMDIPKLIQRAKRAHARAMQIMHMREPTYNDEGSETVTREDLVKATEEDAQKLMAEAKAKSGEVIDRAEEVVQEKPKLISRPPKAPTKRATKK